MVARITGREGGGEGGEGGRNEVGNELRFVWHSGLHQRLSPPLIHTRWHTRTVHFKCPSICSYNSRHLVFEHTDVWRNVCRDSWQAQARTNWLAHHNYRSHLCSHRATATSSTTSPRPTLSKCHLDCGCAPGKTPKRFLVNIYNRSETERAGRGGRCEGRKWNNMRKSNSPPPLPPSNEVCCQLYLTAAILYCLLHSSGVKWLRFRVHADDIWASFLSGLSVLLTSAWLNGLHSEKTVKCMRRKRADCGVGWQLYVYYEKLT